ncbi:hypothetical protein [Mycolicibacterium llatzerense]|uniref:hypothetical protein n=1 Tax=Mycolicibacterium llatzerense TaxID=280871 RepID=UPI0021B6B073|nr:hypothetical protein [Mycolicibacterium llatzerense]
MESVADVLPLTGRTTALLWGPAAAHWRGTEGGTAGAVLAAALAALESPGYRWPIPAPEAAEVGELVRAGSALNDAVRQRYVRGANAGAVAAASAAVTSAARALGAAQPQGAATVALCVGKRDRLVHLRLDPRLHAAMRAAAAANGMGFGAWVRDAVAAAVHEHQPRRPAEETRTARAVCGRIAGLLVQAADVAASGSEVAAIGAAEDAVAAASARLSRWGSRR